HLESLSDPTLAAVALYSPSACPSRIAISDRPGGPAVHSIGDPLLNFTLWPASHCSSRSLSSPGVDFGWSVLRRRSNFGWEHQCACGQCDGRSPSVFLSIPGPPFPHLRTDPCRICGRIDVPV